MHRICAAGKYWFLRPLKEISLPPAISLSHIEGLSRPQQVAEAIKQRVMENRWQTGDRLRPEAELIDRFGMAKGTTREAVRILEAQGLVKSRMGPGGGVRVHQVSKERARARLAIIFTFSSFLLMICTRSAKHWGR